MSEVMKGTTYMSEVMKGSTNLEEVTKVGYDERIYSPSTGIEKIYSPGEFNNGFTKQVKIIKAFTYMREEKNGLNFLV